MKWVHAGRTALLFAVPVVVFHSFLVRDAKLFQKPEFARIFFWHFPMPIIATVLLSMAAWFGFRFLKSQDARWDIRASACTEIASVMIILTMISGIFFSRIQWGDWWQNDPRQISFLLVMAIYAGYFVLRSAYSDPALRATYSNGYLLFAFLPFLFLTFVFPRLPQVDTFHPNESIMSGNIKGGYAWVVLEVFIVVSWLTQWIYSLRVRSEIISHEIEEYGYLENTRGTTRGSVVVRPISDSEKS